MKKTVFLLMLFRLGAGLCFAEADPVEGYWTSVDDKTGKVTAGWEIYQEGGTVYGKILSVAGFPQDALTLLCKASYAGFPLAGRVNQMRVVGTPWIFGLRRNREGEWSGGNVINPEDGNMYRCKITFHRADGRRYTVDTLEMRGEIGLGIGRSQFWRKSTREEAAGLR
jgi:uncharacterized protein (DUF2147 family)